MKINAYIGRRLERRFILAEPYMVLQTKEDFEKIFNQIHDLGYNKGFKDGLTHSLGYIMAAIDEDFDEDVRREAEFEAGRINRMRFERKQDRYKELKESAVKEYIEKVESEKNK